MIRLLAVTTLLASTPLLAEEAPAAESASPTLTLDALTKKIDALERLHLSGYIQARYVTDQSSTLSNPRDTFTVRRGRLKATYDADWSMYVLQIDASSSGVTLKDAEVHLIEPWTPYKLEMVVGQTKWPFGYEILESSSVREFPERARVIRAFGSNERDIGAKLNAKIGWFRFTGGVFNGNGIDRPAPFNGRDNDNAKDVIGRAGFDFKWISGGISGWYGYTFRHASTVPGAGGAQYFPRNRIGADLQIRADVLPIGKTILKGEYIKGRTYWVGNVEAFGLPASGFYGIINQYIGKNDVLSFRYDYFDPLNGTEAEIASNGRPAATNPVGTYAIAFSHTWYEQVRLTASYEIPVVVAPDGTSDPKDNLLTLQAQVKF